MNENWKQANGSKGYSVSDLGRVRRDSTGQILTPAINSVGYQYVGKNVGVTTQPVGLHRVIASVFVPNPEGKRDVNHKNGIRHDNRAENLEWATHGENIMHAVKEGRWRRKQSPMPVSQALEIRALWATGEQTLTKLANRYKVGPSTISAIVNHRSFRTAA